MSEFAAMLSRHAQAGRVTWIGVRPARKAAMVVLDSGRITFAGLDGDRRTRSSPRAVTLIQAEHLAVIGALLGREPVSPELLRRNIVVAGLNLAACRDRDLRLGGAVVRITGVCAPCSRMEAALGWGGYTAMRGHGGMTAEVLVEGDIAIGDEVIAL